MTRDADISRFPFLVNVEEARTLSTVIAAAQLAKDDEDDDSFHISPLAFACYLASAFLLGVIAERLI